MAISFSSSQKQVTRIFASVREPWQKFLVGKAECQKQVPLGYMHRQVAALANLTHKFLMDNNPSIMQEFVKTLDTFGYLTKDWMPLSSKDFKGMPGETEQ